MDTKSSTASATLSEPTPMTVKAPRPDRQHRTPQGPTPPRPSVTDKLLRQPQSRWQRTARYCWDKGGSKGGR